MNDPKDIVVTITKSKEEGKNALDQSIDKDDKRNIPFTENAHFNYLIIHLKEILSKKLYIKAIKEINTLFDQKYFEDFSLAWKISILKIKAMLKIIKKKIIKYLINLHEKVKIRHHIHNIKNYLNQIPIELNNFYLKYNNIKIEENAEMVDELLYCYFYYIYLISIFHKRIGNVIDSITYLSFIIRLYKETKLVVKSGNTLHKIEKCFILLSPMLICNEDYSSCIEYLNIAMDICLKNIIYQTENINDGVYQGDKNKVNSFKKNIRRLSQILI